jgi:hypothetical protein
MSDDPLEEWRKVNKEYFGNSTYTDRKKRFHEWVVSMWQPSITLLAAGASGFLTLIQSAQGRGQTPLIAHVAKPHRWSGRVLGFHSMAIEAWSVPPRSRAVALARLSPSLPQGR